MKSRFIITIAASALLAATTLGMAVARPHTTPPKGDAVPGAVDDRSDSFHITMRAGKGRLGVTVVEIGSELRAHFAAPKDRGVLVDAVKPDSPAAHAGVRVGDVIVEVDGAAASSAMDMLDAVSDRKKGDKVAITLMRGGQRHELRATLAEDPGFAWRRGQGGPIDSEMRGWFDRMPELGTFDRDARRLLEDVRKRMEDMGQRLDKLERR